MNFSKWDIGIMIAMSFAVISMSFVFPALGLSGSNVQESEIPSFNITTERFDWTGEFPDRPGTPSSGILRWNSDITGASDNQIWLDGDTTDGTELVLLNNGTPSNPQPEVLVNNWDGGSAVTDEYIFNDVGDILEHDNFSYIIQFEYVTNTTNDQGDRILEVSYDIEQQPSDTTWYGRIPFLGGVVSAGNQLAGILGWIGTVFWWASATIVTTVLNFLGITFDVITFLLSTFYWIVGTYTSVITGAPSWVGVFLAIPGLLLSIELGKVTLLIIQVLPP